MAEVHFFGNFRIEDDGKTLDEQTVHSKKLLKLLAYFLLNNGRMPGTDELGEFLWGNGGSTNPSGALKNLVYRLRNVLKELGNKEYILSSHGAYGWNSQIPVHIDIQEFELLAQQTRKPFADIQEKIEAYETAAAVYSRPRTEKLLIEPWLAARFEHCKTIYMAIVKELCSLYEKTQDYEKMTTLCEAALDCDSLDEDMHCWIIRSWIGRGELDRAMTQYNEAERNLYGKLGIYRSERLGRLYDEIIQIKNTGTASMNDVYEDICEGDPSGVFFCEYAVFREIYRLEARRKQRTGSEEYVMLVSVHPDGNLGHELGEEGVRKAMMQLQNTLRSSLRMGDVAARCSDTQYIVLLVSCDDKSAAAVAERITDSFNRHMKKSGMVIRYELKEVSQETLRLDENMQLA